MTRHSLRFKINLAILATFACLALLFVVVLSVYESARRQAALERVEILLASVLGQRYEDLANEIFAHQSKALSLTLESMVRVPGVLAAAAFDAEGRLMAMATGVPGAAISDLSESDRRKLVAKPAFERLGFGEGEALVYAERLRLIGEDIGYASMYFSTEELDRAKRRTLFLFALYLVVALGIMTLMLNALLRRFVLTPAAVLNRAMDQVSQGRYGLTIGLSGQDEIARMAASFDAMSVKLGETAARLAESQRTLEDRVARRTAELTESNERLVREIAERRRAEEALRESEERYRAMFFSNQAIKLIIDPADGSVVEANQAAADFYGYPRDTLLTKKVSDASLNPPESVVANMRVALSRERSLFTSRHKVASGKVRDVEIYTSPLNVGGRALLFSIIFDVTERKRIEAELQAAMERAEGAARAKSDFLAVMSHEIRTPLNAVIGLADLLLSAPLGPDNREHLAGIKDSAMHLLSIIDDILDFSKIEAGKLRLDRIDFDLPATLTAALRPIEATARAKGLDFVVSVAPEVPKTLRGDPLRLRQVLTNLAGNAVKFTEKGRVAVSVDRGPERDGQAFLRCAVEDTGIGIPPDKLSGIFSSFTQAAGSITRRYGGTGLGLAISRQLIGLMGGHVSVASEEGRGSAFTFTMPLDPGDPDSVPARDEAPSPPGAPGEGLRVLLIEDNALNARVTELHLARMGHRVETASSAGQGLERLASEDFDLVLMDIEMPGMDGLSATRLIRAGGDVARRVRRPDLPILALTAHALPEIREACLAAGMNDFLTKPVNYVRLESILDHLRGRETILLAPDETELAALPPRPSERPAPRVAPTGGDAPSLDMARARREMGLTPEQHRGLVAVCLKELASLSETLRAALERDEAGTAASAAHTLKSTAATMGAYAARELALALEKNLRAGNLADARRVFEALERELEVVRQAVGETGGGEGAA